jgi:hypothetical protein
MIACLLLLVLGIGFSGALRAQTDLLETVFSPAEEAAFEERGATIGRVDIRVDNVFDLENPAENNKLYRALNRFHFTTRDAVVESILLFRSGDPFSPQALEESARLLRVRGFVAEAAVRAVRYDVAANTVDVDVRVRDSWSFTPEIRLGRSGGENKYGIGVSESNLLGTGKDLTLLYVSDVDRDETLVRYFDGNVRGGRTRLEALASNSSDGGRYLLSAERPFYALDARWAVGGAILEDERIESMYDLGEVVDEFRQDTREMNVHGGWSRGLVDDRVLRWRVGLAYEEDLFRADEEPPPPTLLPEDRELLYPWFGIEIIRNDFRQMTELNDMGRVEDVQLGHALALELGFASEGFGSDRDAVIFRAFAHKGWDLGAGRLLVFDAASSARWEEDGLSNGVFEAGARYFRRNLERHLFMMSFNATASEDLDAENQIQLGGDNGLRGYPLRYQSGEHRALFTIEQRFFTDWYPFRLFRVGSALFFDAGRTWGRDPRGTPSMGMLYDVGFGFRLTSPRSSGRSVVHVDLAFPLNGDDSIDDVQLIVETKASF